MKKFLKELAPGTVVLQSDWSYSAPDYDPEIGGLVEIVNCKFVGFPDSPITMCADGRVNVTLIGAIIICQTAPASARRGVAKSLLKGLDDETEIETLQAKLARVEQACRDALEIIKDDGHTAADDQAIVVLEEALRGEHE